MSSTIGMCNSYKEELLACNLTVLSHCPACKANGLDVLAANHPSLPVAAASIPTPSPDCTSSSSSIQQEQLLRDINTRLDKHEARMEQLLELVEGNANNIRNETNSVISSSSSPRDADVQGGSNGVPSSSSSRKRSSSNVSLDVEKSCVSEVEEKRPSKKNSSTNSILQTFFSQTWQDEDATNGSLDSVLAQLASIVDIGDRTSMMNELRKTTPKNARSVEILMSGGFKATLIEWFNDCIRGCRSTEEENQWSMDVSNMKYVNNLLITIDEATSWSSEELTSNRLDKSIKTYYKSCKDKEGGESEFTEYLKEMWAKYRGLMS